MLNLIKKGLFYTFSVGTESLIAVALLPLLTSNLNPHDYGLWTILFSFVIFLRPVLNLMFQDIIRMKYYDSSENELLSLIKLSIIIPLIIGILISLLQLTASNQIESLLHFPSSNLWKAVLFAALHGFYYFILALLQFKDKHSLFLIQQILQAAICILGTFIFLKLGFSWLSPLYSRSLALSINCIIGYNWIIKNIGNPFKITIKNDYLNEILITAFKFLPIGLCGVTIPLVDRLIVSHLQGIEETSYLGIGGLFSSAIIIVATGFIYAWQPLLYKAINSKTHDTTIKYYSIVYFISLPIIAVALSVVGIFVAPYMMKYDINLVKPYIIWLNVATVSECFYLHNYIILKGFQRTTLLSSLATILIFLNLALVYYYVNQIGGIGAAFGTSLCYLSMTIVSGLFIILKKS